MYTMSIHHVLSKDNVSTILKASESTFLGLTGHRLKYLSLIETYEKVETIFT